MLSHVLFTMFTHDFASIHTSNSVIKLTDDTSIVGLISDSEETACSLEVEHL